MRINSEREGDTTLLQQGFFSLRFKDQTTLVISPGFAFGENGEIIHEFQEEVRNTFINVFTGIILQRAYK